MNYKLAIFGDSGVGKTSFIKRHVTGEFSWAYVPTTSIESYQLRLNSNVGKIQFTIYDGPESEIPDIDGAIIMLDLTENLDLFWEHAIQWYFKILTKKVIPVVLCGNKSDLVDHEDPKFYKIGRLLHVDYKELHLSYFDMSTSSNYNFEKPFLYLARKLMNKETLMLC